MSVLIAHSTKKSKTTKGECAYFLSQFLAEKKRVDLASYVEAVQNRFAALLRFSVPDGDTRFDAAAAALAHFYQPSLSFAARPSPLVDPPAAELSDGNDTCHRVLSQLAQRAHVEERGTRGALHVARLGRPLLLVRRAFVYSRHFAQKYH